jgi:enoyl-CoA hydratase
MKSGDNSPQLEPLVIYERTGSTAWLRLNRPATMNSLNSSLVDQFNSGIDRIKEDTGVRVVVITGVGRSFCSGADLKEAIQSDGSIDPDVFLPLIKKISSTIERIPALTKPVIAAVNGLALAGGMELMMACDLVVAATSALIGDAHSNYGLVPGAGGAARLGRISGPIVSKYLAFTGDFLPAASLVPWGLVNETVPDSELEERVALIAQQIARKSAAGLRHMKRLINTGLETSFTEALALEHELLAIQSRHEDMREGLAAFQEKREPRFSGT